MSIKELYNWAIENGFENCDIGIAYAGDDGYNWAESFYYDNKGDMVVIF